MDNLIQQFYTAFSNQDIDGMVACYSDSIVFEDPAFGKLEGDRAKNMWRMLLESQKGKDFQVQFSNVSQDDKSASAKWEAKYTFSKTGRKVHNLISSQMLIEDGKIVQHTDHFNLRTWAKQALGIKGAIFGGTGFFKKSLQKQTNSLLDRFEAKNS